jgi:serine acetyltransferase
MTIKEMIDLIRWDMRANSGVSFDSLRAKLLLIEIRLEQYVYRKVGQRTGLPKAFWYLCRFLGSIFQWKLCNSGVSGMATIGRGPRLPHPQNIIIAHCAEIGDFCTIYQNVSIVWSGFKPIVPSRPQIGDQVLIGTGAIIIGDVSIGSYVLIGAGAIVTDSIPDYSRVTSTKPNISSRHPSPQAAEPGSERHMRHPYSIWA